MLRVERVLPPPVLVRTPQESAKALEYLAPAPCIAFDTESTGLSRQKDIALFISISDGRRRYCIGPDRLLDFKEFFEAGDKVLIGHNFNFDAWMLRNIGIRIHPNAPRVDTLVMHGILNDLEDHSLDDISMTMLGINKKSFTAEFEMGKGKNKKTPGEVLLEVWLYDPERIGHYASLDAYATYLARDAIASKMASHITPNGYSLLDYYTRYDMPFTRILYDMETRGVLVNQHKLQGRMPKLEEDIYKISRWFAREAGEILKPSAASKTLQNFFFNKLKKTPLKYTEKGNKPSLDSETLETWANQGCIYSQKLIEWRRKSDLLSKYVVGMLEHVGPEGRVHTTFKQGHARTGRLASEDPNLQNVDPEIKDVFEAGPGKIFLDADYSQVEWRVAAELSGDPKMLEDIFRGRDAHSSTAEGVFGVDYNELTTAKEATEPTPRQLELLQIRKFAKTLNFGVLFGEGPMKASKQLGVTIDEAKNMLHKFRDTYPELMRYFRRVIEAGKDSGVCYTLLGRPRQLPNLNSEDSALSSADERRAKNSPIQGSALDIIKAAMLQLDQHPYFTSGAASILLQIHDELVVEANSELQNDPEFLRAVTSVMTSPSGIPTLHVPLEVTVGWGYNWKEVKK